MRIYTYRELMDWKVDTLLPDLEAGRITAIEFRQTIRRVARQLKRGLSANAKVTQTRIGRRMREQRGQSL
jgi:hypothetical protein